MPTVPEAIAIAVKHHLVGELDAAKGMYQKVLNIAPDHPDALHLLGVLSHQNDNNEAAVDYISRAIALCPDKAPFHCNLGVVHRALKNLDQAVASYRQALELTPDYAEAHNNLGNVLEDQDRLEEAVASFTRALQLNPKYPEALTNLANVLRAQGQHEEAIANCRRALQIQPDYPDAHNSLGTILQVQRKYSEAEASFRRALEIKPQKHQWHNNLAAALRCQGEVDAAAASLDESLRIEPDQPLAELTKAILCPIIFESNAEIDRCHQRLLTELKRLADRKLHLEISEIPTTGWELAWSLLFHGRNTRPIKEAMANVFRGCFPEGKPRLGTGRPKVGLVVTDSHERIFIRFMQGALEHFNPELFEAVVVCSEAGAKIIRERIDCPSIQIMTLPTRLDRAADVIREAQFDLLYYWEVGTDAANYFLPFFRLAPVQCTSGGVQATSGIPQMDYYLSSRDLETEESDAHYTETLIRTKTNLVSSSPPTLPESLKPREAFDLTADQHVYLCAQKMQKYHPDLDPLLAGILRKDPLGVVVLLGFYKGRPAYKLADRLQATMPDVVNRVVVKGHLPFDDYLGIIAAADVILDPMHYGGGTTSHDSFFLGKPVVTLPTSLQISRGPNRCYRKMGVMDCVASTGQEYIDIAVRLGTDAEYRAKIEERIRATSHRLFDNMEAVRELEHVFVELIEKSRSLQTPGTLAPGRPKAAAGS